MSLGVLNNIAAIYAENNLNQTQASLQNTLTQLSSGSRINSGADDAAGLSVVDGLQANVAALTQSTENASDGIGLLQTADGALSQVTNLLNRAVTLATEAANGTLDTQQVSSANQEYQNILSEIGDIGSTTNFNGTTAFSSTAKAVFVSDGSSAGSNTYNEITGALSDSSVGVSSPGTASLSIPTASAPVGTTTVGAVAATTANSVSAVAGTPTPGATLTAVTGATSTGATASTPSSLTTVGLTSGETLTGTIEVQDGSNGLVSATLSGQSGQAAVNILNAAFGYNNTTGQFGASGWRRPTTPRTSRSRSRRLRVRRAQSLSRVQPILLRTVAPRSSSMVPATADCWQMPAWLGRSERRRARLGSMQAPLPAARSASLKVAARWRPSTLEATRHSPRWRRPLLPPIPRRQLDRSAPQAIRRRSTAAETWS
jgi:flagellin-like hook-associated protein FlgL